MKLHGEEVKLGDKVWHLYKGWGEVVGLDEGYTGYPISVRWGESCQRFTKDGKWHVADVMPTLFWQPFEIPKKPKEKKEKVWQWVYFDQQDELYGLTYGRYSSADDFYFKFNSDRYEAIGPLQLSEKERDVKE